MATELVFENGLPVERMLTDDDLLLMEDRMETSYALDEPLSSQSEPSTNSTAEPSSLESIKISGGPPDKNSTPLDYRRRAVAYWKGGGKKKFSIAHVRNRFRKVKNIDMLRRWEKQLNPGARSEKLRLIFDGTYEEYIKVRLACF